MLNEEEIVEVCRSYKIDCHSIGRMIDTSKCDSDKRYHYPINDQYFLKVSNNKAIDECNLEDIARLIDRYHSIGVYSPQLFRNLNGRFTYVIKRESECLTCYLEEKAIYPFKIETPIEDYAFKKEMLSHVGKLASKYSGRDLSTVKSMWSLIELAPLDIEIDEKQENFNGLIACLEDLGYDRMVKKLLASNDMCRWKIKEAMKTLPRCVYQGDLNNSNVLVDEKGKFKGIIDFNLFGTEVNINCFLNESMYYMQMDDFEKLSAAEIYEKLVDTQACLLSSITENYSLSQQEKKMIPIYNKVLFTSFWPNASLMVKCLKAGHHTHKILSLLGKIIA